MNEANVTKFKRLIAELFMFDQANLDFGIYRIMNTKRAEIKKFLDDDLIPQIREELQQLGTSDIADLEAQLKKAVAAARELGVDDPENTGKAKELRAKIEDAKRVVELENEVFDDLYDFFRRYYSSGDYLALRRYKEGVYAIPYEGEEVKLHWANADQYYIKSTEYFRDYTFKLNDGRRVHFKLVEADTEQNNNKPTNGNERRFMLCDGEAIIEQDGELFICFEYKPDPDKRTQANLNIAARERIFATTGMIGWIAEFARALPTDSDPTRTLLDKYLTDYTARNTFDYFIHKDVGAFLRRELDFFIKTEIMHLDDVENADEKWFSRYRAHVKAFRKVARKVIDFLAQLENFQKKLWLKKKFVIETNYCVTLDRVPESLYPEIAANEAQREEWVRLFAIDEMTGDLVTPGYSVPLTVEFLLAHSNLLLDTSNFAMDFRNRLLSSVDAIDETSNGLLIHSENTQALHLISRRYESAVSCIHIDPPYNTDSSGFLYKNGFRHSTWLSLMQQSLSVAHTILDTDGILMSHIDEYELERLQLLLDQLGFVNEGTLIWDKGTPLTGSHGLATQHEYVLFRAKQPVRIRVNKGNISSMKRQVEYYMELHGGRNEDSLRDYRKWLRENTNLSKGEKTYNDFDQDGVIFRSDNMSATDKRTDPKFYIPLIHPITQQPCPVPENGWRYTPNSLKELFDQGLVLFGDDHTITPRKKTRLEDNETSQLPTIYSSGFRGKAELDDLGLVFPFAHSTDLYTYLIYAATRNDDDYVLDFFAGSGTTAHAVIEINRRYGAKHKYLLVEMGEYFNSVTNPRVKKAIYSPDWREGKPVSRKGESHMFKYLTLESYEDVLNNLRLTPLTDPQHAMLALDYGVREDYVLRYMLDVESRPSLLNIERLEEPFDFQMDIGTGTVGETRRVNVDVVETFNYLIGLRVRRLRSFEGIRTVEGELANGQRVLILWRSLKQVDNDALDAFFQREHYGADPLPFDLVYANGENFIANLRRDDEVWSVRLIEEDFFRLMFDVQDV